MRVTQSSDGTSEFLYSSQLIAMSSTLDAILYIEIPWSLHLQYTKVRFFYYSGSMVDYKQLLELHGQEGGSVPATFQVIYMV